MASPTSFSLPYISAVSMCRYPVFRAVLTAATVSPGSIWNTPKPNWGIDLPLLSKISGTAVTTDSLLRRWDSLGCRYPFSLPALPGFIHRVG